MENLSKTKIWLAQIRANFLILAVLLVGIGLAAFRYRHDAAYDFNIFHAILLLIGVVIAHASVNLFNEYSDFRTKIDFNTPRNPFSGGSGMLTNGHTKPKNVLTVSIATLLAAVSIGIYFAIVSHWFLLVIIITGVFAVLFYTNFLAKILLGELFAGLTLGSLVVIGTYISMTATPQMAVSELVPLKVILLSIPPGILTSLLLLLNEFPDSEADRQGGRFHLVIKLGKKKAAYVYTAGLIITFAVIVLLPIINLTSLWVYIALVTIPVAIKVSITAIRSGHDNQKIIPVLAQNVMIVLGTDLLLAIGILI